MELINLLWSYKFLLEARWLPGFNEEGICPDLETYIRDILRMAEALEMNDEIENKIVGLPTINHVISLHDELAKKQLLISKPGMDDSLPAPPIKGHSIIMPISNPHSLFLEGLEQLNCVYRYLDDIVSGEYYVYQVKGQERATLGVFIASNKGIVIDQLLPAGNQPVSSETKILVSK